MLATSRTASAFIRSPADIRWAIPATCAEAVDVSNSLPEPWLRGPLTDVPLHVMPVFFCFAQVREDLARHTSSITRQQLWMSVAGSHSLGFHLKHIAGSIDRLTTYLAGGQLSPAQLHFLETEHVAEHNVLALMALLGDRLQASQDQLLQITPDMLYEPRAVGRHSLPTTVIGLLVHLAEHTQRHLGQAVLISKILQLL